MKRYCRIYPGLLLVWELVQSMSKRDKIVFKDLARTQGGKAPANENEVLYLRFFNTLEAAKVFDKARIKEKLAGARILNDLSDSCSYLYHAILRALQVSSEGTISEVADVTAQIKALLHKGLHHHIPPLYEQAMEFARETEEFEDMLKLMRLWRLSLKTNKSEQLKAGEYARLAATEREVWEKHENLHEWEQLDDLRWVAYGLTGEERAKILASIANHPLVMNDGPCLSVKADIRRHLIHDRPLANLNPIQAERIPKLIKIASLIEEHPKLFEDTLIVDRYLNVVSSIGILGAEFKITSAVELAIQRLQQFGQVFRGVEVLLFERVEEINVIVARNSGDFRDSDELIERILQGLASFGECINRKRRVNFYLAIAEIYLLTGRPSAVARLLAPVLEKAPLEDSPRPNILLWVYYLIAEYELGNAEIMQSWAKYAQKYLKVYEIMDEAGSTLVSFLAKLSRKFEPSKRISEFRRFGREVLPILSMTENNYYLIRFPFASWMECKLEGRKFAVTPTK